MADIVLDARTAIERALPGTKRRASAMPFVIIGLATAAAGAVLAYVLDPQLGRTRRAVTRDRMAGGARRVGQWSARQARSVASTATGVGSRARNAEVSRERTESADEVVLVARVKSEAFRDADIDKGGIVVNAENDVVYLRGTVADQEQGETLRMRVEKVEGVGRVVNLLRVEGDENAELERQIEEESRPTWALPH
jgi:hypothetical protein